METKSGKLVTKIGIGTWTIDKSKKKNEIEALDFYVKSGINYIDVVLAYDNGKTLDVISEFIKRVKREDVFINALITHGCKNVEDIEKQINHYLEVLGTDYLDCVTLHSPVICENFGFDNYVKEIERLYRSGKFLNIGYSNLSPEQFSSVKNRMIFFEGLYNLENRINEDNGIIDECLKNNIEFYAYQPLRRNRTASQNYKELVSLAKKYNKTQNQILINWLIKHKNIGILIKSSNKKHISENLEALKFEMAENDYKTLDKFRNIKFDQLPFSYVNEEGKIRIDQIPNQNPN